MPPIVHVMAAYRAHGRALALGGVTSAAAALASLDPTHRLTHTPDVGPDNIVHLHHALAFEGLPNVAHLIKTVHVLQRRQSRLRGATDITRSEAQQVAILTRADRVTVATDSARAMLLEDHPEVPDLEHRLSVMPLVPPQIRPRAPRGPRPLVVAVTRFDKLKGTDLLVEVLGRLLDDDLDVVIAGGLPDHTKYQRRWLETFAATIPTSARDRFTFAGWLESKAVEDLLAKADLMLAPSRLETCGLSVMEAMAASCPIVAFDTPTHREVAGSAALYADDTPSMIELARSVLASPALSDRLSAAGPGRVRNRTEVIAQWLHFWAQTR